MSDLKEFTTIQPIETRYRGYCFRSRTEARWAVFFDAAGIEWQYELQGFNVGGRNYLPDFWLPRQEMFVEIKPTIEACKAAGPLMCALVLASGHPGLLIAGAPNSDEPPGMIHVGSTWGGKTSAHAATWTQCGTCNHVTINHQCNCTAPAVTIIAGDRLDDGPRVTHALEQAQQARFEHGEDGRPESYLADNSIVRVYVAGAVIEDVTGTITNENGELEPFEHSIVLPWRKEIFGDFFDGDDEWTESECPVVGQFQYRGPTIRMGHGEYIDGLGSDCLDEVHNSDVLFAWIDRAEQIGTIAEIGAAYAWGKPIFVALANEDLSRHFYFVRQLATVAIIAPDAVSAWQFFMQWQNR